MSGPMLMGDAPGTVLKGALISFLGVTTQVGGPAVGAAGWERFLDWCRTAMGVDGAFAIDPEGLVIAQRGPLSADLLDELSARLVLAVEHAHRLAADADGEFAMVIRYRGRYVTVLRLTGDTVFKVCLVGPKPVHPALLRPDSIVDADWQGLMAWIGAPVHQEGAFLVDDRGLMVAQNGALDPLVAQSIGARLSLVYDQIDRVKSIGASQWLALYYDRRWLVSMRVKASKTKNLVFGAVGPVPVHAAKLMDLKRVLRQKLKTNPRLV